MGRIVSGWHRSDRLGRSRRSQQLFSLRRTLRTDRRDLPREIAEVSRKHALEFFLPYSLTTRVLLCSTRAGSLATASSGDFCKRQSCSERRCSCDCRFINHRITLQNLEGERNGLNMSTIAATLDNYITPIGLSPTLQRPTLVLNRNWQPINVATVARALIMLWNDSAKIVDPVDYQLYNWSDWSRLVPDRDEPFIQSVRQRIRIPEVIALTKFDAMPTRTVTFSRRNVFKRDKMTCQYCGKQPGSEELTIDHVVPRAQGGLSSWTNCVLACIDCNSKKADRTPAQAHMKLRKEPVRPAWKPIYADRMNRVKSWSKFISEAYWIVELED